MAKTSPERWWLNPKFLGRAQRTTVKRKPRQGGIHFSCHEYLLSICNVSDAILITGEAEMDYTDAVGAFHSKERNIHISPLLPSPINNTYSFSSTLHANVILS